MLSLLDHLGDRDRFSDEAKRWGSIRLSQVISGNSVRLTDRRGQRDRVMRPGIRASTWPRVALYTSAIGSPRFTFTLQPSYRTPQGTYLNLHTKQKKLIGSKKALPVKASSSHHRAVAVPTPSPPPVPSTSLALGSHTFTTNPSLRARPTLTLSRTARLQLRAKAKPSRKRTREEQGQGERRDATSGLPRIQEPT